MVDGGGLAVERRLGLQGLGRVLSKGGLGLVQLISQLVQFCLGLVVLLGQDADFLLRRLHRAAENICLLGGAGFGAVHARHG